ncbi:MAG: hypothetical protein ABJH72_14715 [Reichenbachiella sp.]|uniref:hypothetical protein n=1 Tax=Reichenbachiella sp. TaxID=2184521 RepID=UPI003263CCC8
MRNILTTLFALFISLTSWAQNHQCITTNKMNYVIGEQVLFDVSRFDGSNVLSDSVEEVVVHLDFVAPDGQIVQTKSLIKAEKDCYFFSLPDSLKTGIYRLIANSEGAFQATKRIHVFTLTLDEPIVRKSARIEYEVQGGILVKNASGKVAVRVTDKQGSGVKTKGTLVNSSDSVVQYLDTDANGMVSFQFNAKDSLYQVRFGQQISILQPIEQLVHCEFNQMNDKFELKLSNRSAMADVITVSVDDELISKYELPAGLDTTLSISKSSIAHGIHKMKLQSKLGPERNFRFLSLPVEAEIFNLPAVALRANEQSEFAFEDLTDEISQLSVSIIDQKNASPLDFYEEYYFDQSDIDLQLVEDRDFEAYLLFFADQVNWKTNTARLNAPKTGGVLKYKSEYPFDEISMLNLTTMKVLDMRSENIHGIQDFEAAVGEKAQVFPYHFTTYLQPIELADFEEKVDYKYPALKSFISLSEKDIETVKSYDIQKNIFLSFHSSEKKVNKLPTADYTYDLENYDVPNTMVDMINYIIKYVSVLKNGAGEPELSMYRYMSTYKYRGSPLIFLNDLPVYDARTILNLNPKDLERVEVRNSYKSNGHLGNFSLNGSVSFYLKESIDNPLEEAYTVLPIIESCKNFNKKVTDNEFAPDFRHQLYWNPNLKKTKDSFWVDLKSSDLSTTYDVQITAFMKNGTVVQKQSELVVR